MNKIQRPFWRFLRGIRRAGRSLRRLVMLATCLLVFASLSGASADTGLLVLMMSRAANGGESNAQSDYASIAYGGATPLDPFPVMVFTSYSTDQLADPNAYEAKGMIEGDGSPTQQQQYDVFYHDERNNITSLISRSRLAMTDEYGNTLRDAYDNPILVPEGPGSESVLASIGVKDENLAVFQSSATNLRSDLADTNGFTDIYLADLYNLGNDPILVSAPSYMAENIQGGNNNSGNTLDNGLTEKIVGGVRTILADWHKPAFAYTALTLEGRYTYVIFESKASNLVDRNGDLTVNENDTGNGKKQIYRRDVTNARTLELSLNEAGEEGNDDSWQPTSSVISNQEGHHVVFVSKATNLVGDDTNGKTDIFLKNTVTQAVTLISRKWNCNGSACTAGAIGNDDSSFPSFSQDGRYIVFQSKASNLVDGDQSFEGKNFTDIFLFDTQAWAAGQQPMRLISMSSDWPGENTGDPDIPGHQANLPSYNPAVISSDSGAHVVAFTSYASNLVDGDTNEYCNYPSIEGVHISNCPDIFVHDMERKQTWRVSLTYDGQESRGSSGWPTLSGNGRFVYFTSISRLLGDGEYTGRRQIYLRDQGNPPGNPNLQPTSWIFPDVDRRQGSDYPHRRFRIVAMATIGITDLHLKSGVNFKILSDSCSGVTLQDGDDCAFEISFEPVGLGFLTDQVQIDLHDENPGMSDRTINAHLQGVSVVKVYVPTIRK